MSICIHITDVYRDLNLRHQVVWEPTTKQDLKRECWRRVGLIVIEHLDEWGKWRELVKSEDTDAVQKVVKKMYPLCHRRSSPPGPFALDGRVGRQRAPAREHDRPARLRGDGDASLPRSGEPLPYPRALLGAGPALGIKKKINDYTYLIDHSLKGR